MRRKIWFGAAIAALVALALVITCKVRGGSDGSATRPSAATPTTSSVSSQTARGARSVPLVAASLAGRVLRASDRAGIPGAVVSIARAELMAMIFPTSTPTIVVVTDADGAWRAPSVMPGPYLVAATAIGFLPGTHAKLVVASSQQRTGIDLVLDAGGTLVRGTVTDVGGGPIPDARITVRRDGKPELSGTPDFVAITGVDGTYQITLPDGSLQATASHEDYTEREQRLELAGEPRTLDFALLPGAVIRGQVVARDSGKPVPGAMVRAEGGRATGGSVDGTVLADATGTFTIRGLGSGAIALTAAGRGYASANPTEVSVGVGEQLDGIRVLVDRAYSISGVVVKRGKPGEPIEGVVLGAFSIASKQVALAIDPSDVDGAFEIIGVRPATYTLGAIGEGSVPEIGKSIEVVDRDVRGVTVELSAGVTIAGRVEPATSKVQISLEPAGGIGFANMFDAVKSLLVHAETDATGAFVLRTVPAGSLMIKAMAPDGHAGSLPIEVAEVDQTNVVVKLEARASVSGRVIDTNGAAVAGARVEATPMADAKPSFSINERSGVTTAVDGRYRIVGLEPGKFRVRVSSDRDDDVGGDEPRKAVQVDLAKGAEKTGVTLTVEARDGTIRGQVVDSGGRRVPDAWVTARRESSVSADARKAGRQSMSSSTPPVLSGPDGRFTIDRLRRGTYQLDAEGPRGASRAQQAGVKTGETVTLTLAALGTLAGKVTVGGAPVVAYDISCDGPAGDFERRIEAVDGAYSLERLAPGAYACHATGEAGSATAQVVVSTGPAKQDFALVRWASVTGVVVSVLTKQPVAGVYVFAGAGDGFGQRAFGDVLAGGGPRTDATGRFVVERVEVGKGNLLVMSKDSTFEPLATRAYTVSERQRLDLGTIEIVPPRNGPPGTFGFATSIDGSKLAVSSVIADGPAAQAGMLEGDRIASINGRTVSDLAPAIAQRLISSGSIGVGESVQLGVERAAGTQRVSLVSVKW